MVLFQRKMILIAIFAMTFGFTSIVVAVDRSDEHSVMHKDADGNVSLENFAAHHIWMFKMNDTNNDGILDKAEMKALHKMVKAMHKRSEAH